MSCNVVVLEGHLARPSELRVLPSGAEVVGLELTVHPTEGPAETVPVSWPDGPAWSRVLDVGAEVVVVGRVRRRFFRAGGSTQSRTEVVASTIVPSCATRRVRTALSRAILTLEEASAATAPRRP